MSGYGPVSFIAQNGIQVGFGASAKLSENTISDNYRWIRRPASAGRLFSLAHSHNPVYAGAMVSLRRPTPLLAAVIGLLVLAPVANTDDGPRTEKWQGTWKTSHRFGTPKLILKQNGDEVKGVYRDNGEEIGEIWGTLSGKRYRTWSGKFKDHGASSKGKFSVHLESDDVSFQGTFKTCGTFVCSDPYTWFGEKQ